MIALAVGLEKGNKIKSLFAIYAVNLRIIEPPDISLLFWASLVS